MQSDIDGPITADPNALKNVSSGLGAYLQMKSRQPAYFHIDDIITGLLADQQRKLSWFNPVECLDPDGNPYTSGYECRQTVRDCINQRRLAYRDSAHEVPDDRHLLMEFIMINWAVACE